MILTVVVVTSLLVLIEIIIYQWLCKLIDYNSDDFGNGPDDIANCCR